MALTLRASRKISGLSPLTCRAGLLEIFSFFFKKIDFKKLTWKTWRTTSYFSPLTYRAGLRKTVFSCNNVSLHFFSLQQQQCFLARWLSLCRPEYIIHTERERERERERDTHTTPSTHTQCTQYIVLPRLLAPTRCAATDLFGLVQSMV